MVSCDCVTELSLSSVLEATLETRTGVAGEITGSGLGTWDGFPWALWEWITRYRRGGWGCIVATWSLLVCLHSFPLGAVSISAVLMELPIHLLSLPLTLQRQDCELG
jgi:hypothetical protein